MSFLTKLFIVLHVVMSMILTAAMVVFINRSEHYTTLLKTEKAQRASAENDRTFWKTDAEQAKSDREAMRNQYEQQLTALDTKYKAALGAIADRDRTIAERESAVQVATAAQKAAQRATEASLSAQGIMQQQLASAREAMDKAQQQATELETMLANRTSERDALSRRLRQALEDNEALKEQMAEGGGGGQGGAEQGGRQASARAPRNENVPDINGEIRAKRMINNVPYATISLGANDNVEEGMQFYVIDRDRGELLGRLTVDSVDAEQATGRLSGRRSGEVRPGNEVRTSLQ